jgi:hypothetical protein
MRGNDGRVINPLIVLHTTGDDVIPFSQATLYMQKVGSGRNVTLIPVSAYGHCAFSSFDLFAHSICWFSRPSGCVHR